MDFARHFAHFYEYISEISIRVAHRAEEVMHQSEPVFEQSTALYESHAPAVLTYLLRHLGSREEAEDMLLEVFTLALEKQSTLRQDERALRAWVLTLARNKVVDYYRRAGRRAHVPLSAAEEHLYASEEREPEQVFLRQEAYTQLQTQVQKLSKAQQEVLHLRFAEGLRCGDIAQVIGRSEKATRALLYRTLKHLRAIYDNERSERGW